jgi:AraC-like DNA-binding protein
MPVPARKTDTRRSWAPAAAPRVAILVDTSTTWGRNILAGVIAYTRTHGRWHLAFIRQQAMLPVRVNEVARHTGVSRRGLERRFMEQLQRTPAAELRRFRLERARQLLTETNLSMSQVAEKTGFGSQAHFASAFRAQFSQSPRQFRRAALGLD